MKHIPEVCPICDSSFFFKPEEQQDFYISKMALKCPTCGQKIVPDGQKSS